MPQKCSPGARYRHCPSGNGPSTTPPMRITDFTRFGFTEVLFPGLDPTDDD